MNTTITLKNGDNSSTVRQTNRIQPLTDFPMASGARRLVLGKTVWVLLGCLVAAAPASADLVLNGSFETPLVNASGNARCDTWGANNWSFYYAASPESTYIFNTAQVGLTPATAGSQAQVFFPANELNGVEPSISQTLSTVPGQTYDLSFDQAAAVWYGQGSKVTVSWITSGGVDLLGVWSRAEGAPYAWETKHFIVTAGSASDTIKFAYADYESGYWGASMLDNVQVNVVPEPTTVALLGAGAAVLGLGLRRGVRNTAKTNSIQL